MNTICLVIDRLHAGYVGAYGNSWIETPCLDRLAARSILFDQALVDSPQLELLYRSYWHGRHAMCPQGPLRDRPTLAAMLRDAGVSTTLLTDEKTVAGHRLAADFDELIEIDPPVQLQVADEIELTHLGKCFAQAISWLETAEEPFLLWCHLAGLGTVWDAPLEFRQAYRDQGDPPPSDKADVAGAFLPPDHDPDQVLGFAQSYAGQVSLLDACLGALLEFLKGSPAGNETLLVLVSARGFPLGEHLRVGKCDDALYGELVHVPWMLRLPDEFGATLRTQTLVQPSDLWATLLDWWGIDEKPPSPSGESLMPIIRGDAVDSVDRLCITAAQGRAIRTPAWYLRTGGETELFAKPDDRWEVNNVADRCQEVVECLEDALLQYEQTVRAGRIRDLPPLSEVLLSGLD